MAEFDVKALIEGWQTASAAIQREVGELCVAAAEAAAAEVRAAYPARSGRLRDSVGTTLPRGYGSSGGVNISARRVLVRAPHVHFVEDGTARRIAVNHGNANRGVMPKQGPIFVPIAVRARAAYLARAQQILERPVEVV